MVRLGAGVVRCSIGRHGDSPETVAARPIPVPQSGFGDCAGRYLLEQNAIILLAGTVVETLLDPSSPFTDTQLDHNRLHTAMTRIERDDTVRASWCAYLWQRTWRFLISPPEQWIYLCTLAEALLEHGRLEGAEVECLLARLPLALPREKVPNAEMLHGHAFIPPWHRGFYAGAAKRCPTAPSTQVPPELRAIGPEIRPLRDVLGPMSTRAWRCLERRGIVTVADLADWSEWALGSIRGAGTRTTSDIAAAARKAGIPLAPDRTYPREINPARW
jgi:hypothetical protein